MIDWFPIRLSFVVASAATLIALIAGSALAWLLARKRFPGSKSGRRDRYVAARFASNGPGLLPTRAARHSFDAWRVSLSHVWNSSDIHGNCGDHRSINTRTASRY